MKEYPFRFQGQYEDKETGLYYNRFRYYSAEEGMYISQDPIRINGGLSLYSYVKNANAWIDTFGLDGHHSDPKFMGGADKQKLTEVPNADHVQLHRDMYAHLETKTKVVAGETVSMRPKKGNSGVAIQRNFSRTERLGALAEFYNNNKSKYPDAAADFFVQHPHLQKTSCP